MRPRGERPNAATDAPRMLHERLALARAALLLGSWMLLAGTWLFVLMAVDKRHARAARRRIPERTLLAWAAGGGAPLGLVAMAVLRHKTRHARFRYGLPALAALWLAVLLWIVRW